MGTAAPRAQTWLGGLGHGAPRRSIIFPVQPCTLANLEKSGLTSSSLTSPLRRRSLPAWAAQILTWGRALFSQSSSMLCGVPAIR